MAKQFKSGGPAFPCESKTGSMLNSHQGMTLRDYFAAKALQGLISSKAHSLSFNPADDAGYCYKIADAMIAAREQSEQPAE